ncbi:hypothetical protein COV13_01420 [Candidatus Woesearchaeota archaeon CG10_big_fil_rev_8_21_14_0_10_32_9]|nr:MAG: hypothetical protein COV13_01420 [Candidatus Woesearchaeota archaeon CG10_big_fil_rev_8_21_14_0_10_32_9]
MNEKYEELKKKYDLPNFKELDSDFELYSIDEDDDLIREILKKIYEKVDSYTKFLEDLLQPDSRISLMREASTLTPVEQALVTKLHMNGMLITRELLEVNLEYDETIAAKIIKKDYEDWQKMKLELKKIVIKLKESWMKEIKTEQDRGYFG